MGKHHPPSLQHHPSSATTRARRRRPSIPTTRPRAKFVEGPRVRGQHGVREGHMGHRQEKKMEMLPVERMESLESCTRENGRGHRCPTSRPPVTRPLQGTKSTDTTSHPSPSFYSCRQKQASFEGKEGYQEARGRPLHPQGSVVAFACFEIRGTEGLTGSCASFVFEQIGTTSRPPASSTPGMLERPSSTARLD